MTEEELVFDTIKYYQNNPRGIETERGGALKYRTDDGKMCAVGRWVDWDLVKEEGLSLSEINDSGSLDGDSKHMILSLLKKEMVHIPLDLWCDLQHYHDYVITKPMEEKIEREEYLIKKWKKQNDRIQETTIG